MSQSKKYRNILENPNVAFVVDDVRPPWSPRGVEVRGLAEAAESDVSGAKSYVVNGVERPKLDSAIIRIRPAQIISWGLEADRYNRKVGAGQEG